jgi:hypothetical protein
VRTLRVILSQAFASGAGRRRTPLSLLMQTVLAPVFTLLFPLFKVVCVVSDHTTPPRPLYDVERAICESFLGLRSRRLWEEASPTPSRFCPTPRGGKARGKSFEDRRARKNREQFTRTRVVLQSGGLLSWIVCGRGDHFAGFALEHRIILASGEQSGDPELIRHEFVHVLQFEGCQGGTIGYLSDYFAQFLAVLARTWDVDIAYSEIEQEKQAYLLETLGDAEFPVHHTHAHGL